MAGSADKREMSDEELLHKVRSEDQEAFNVLRERHHGPLSRIVYRITNDYEKIEDACQHAFLALFVSIINDRYDIKKLRVLPFLCKVARNKIISEWRKEKKLKEAIEGGKIKPRGGADDPGNNVIAAEVQEIIKSVLLKFPEQERKAYILYYWTPDMNFEKISRILGVSINTARNYAYQTKNILCHQLRLILDQGEIDSV